MPELATCSCALLKVNGAPTTTRNWNSDCPEHGVKSEWYGSAEQTTKRAEDSVRLRDLQ
jgi:hypothetical protein